MRFYAQIDDTGHVVAVTQTAEPVDQAHMIPIAALDNTLLGMAYVDGEFVPGGGQ